MNTNVIDLYVTCEL